MYGEHKEVNTVLHQHRCILDDIVVSVIDTGTQEGFKEKHL